MNGLSYEDVERNLTNQPPQSEEVIQRMEQLRTYAKAYARSIFELVPPSRERSLAVTHLEQTTMWAIGGIARNQDTQPTPPVEEPDAPEEEEPTPPPEEEVDDEPPPDLGDVDEVQIGTSRYAIQGVNTYRNPDHLILYTRVDQTHSPANRWGLEVTVLDGTVLEIHDRENTDGPAPEIPVGGYVLSGHGAARRWLIANAKVGSAVTVRQKPAVEVPTPLPSRRDLVLHVDFNRASKRPGYDDKYGMREVWQELAPGYLARSYGEHKTRLIEIDGEIVMEAKFQQGGPTSYIGFRLGESAKRLNLGHDAWLTYDIWLDPRTPMNEGDKQPGLAAGDDFPSAGSNSPLSDNWKGMSARMGRYAGKYGGVGLPSDARGPWWRCYAYHYQEDRIEWPRGSGPGRGGEHLFCKTDNNLASVNPASARWQAPLGQWWQAAERIICNTSPTRRDGGVELYCDGVKRLDRPEMRWWGPKSYASVQKTMGDPTKGIDGFYFSSGFNIDVPYHVVRYRNFRFGKSPEAVSLLEP